MATAPDDAAAIDVPCPICGRRPIEEAATAVHVTGFLIAYSIKRKQVIGCGTCTRNALLKTAGKTLVTGWWSITSAIINPFVFLYDVLRAPYTSGPSRELADTLRESGIEVRFLERASDFDPGSHVQNEALMHGLVQLGVAVMLADGDAGSDEAAELKDILADLFPEQDDAELESMIEETARERPRVEDAVAGLGDILTDEGRDAALQIATSVAGADGTVDDREVAVIGDVASGLGMEMGPEEIEMLVSVQAGQDLEAALEEYAES